MCLGRNQSTELSSIDSCFAWWRFGVTFIFPFTYLLLLVFRGVFFSALSELSFVVLYRISSTLRFLCSTRKQAFDSCTVFSGAWMHRTHGLFQLYNAASCRPSSWSCPVLLFSRCIVQKRPGQISWQPILRVRLAGDHVFCSVTRRVGRRKVRSMDTMVPLRTLFFFIIFIISLNYILQKYNICI